MDWGVDLQFLCPWAVQGSFSWEWEGIKAPTFILTDRSHHFPVITGLILQQPHKAVTLISSHDIWGNWGPDNKGLAESTYAIKGGVRLAFQDLSCCGVFGDRIKLTWGPWVQSRASGIQSGKLEAWEVKRPDKWVLTLEDPWESNKSMACLPQNSWVVPLSLFLSHTHSHKYTHIPKTEFPRQ